MSNGNAEAISALKEDRQALLNRIAAIERLSEFLGMAPEHEAEGLPLLTNQIHSLEDDLECHARKEEQGLFSLIIDMEKARGSELVVPLVAEHRDLKNDCGELDRTLRGLSRRTGEPHRWQALKAIEHIRDLCELIRDHLETELKQLFPALAAERINSTQTRRRP